MWEMRRWLKIGQRQINLSKENNMSFEGMFKVHAGDFSVGVGSQWITHSSFWGSKIPGRLEMVRDGKFSRETINVSAIESIEIVTEENATRIGGLVGWGVAGATLLGPVGLLAGLLRGGKGKDVTFICKLKDGRKFLANGPKKIYTEISIALFK
jgi:hypothetical protein